MRVQKPDCMYFTNLQNEGTCHRYARILVSDVCSYEDEMFVQRSNFVFLTSTSCFVLKHTVQNLF